MKASELREGQDYSYKRGKYDKAIRVTLIDAPVHAKGTYGYGPRTHALVRYDHPYVSRTVEERIPLSQIVRTWGEQEEVDRLNEEYQEEQRQERAAQAARADELNRQLSDLGLEFSLQGGYGGYKLVSTRYNGFEAAEELIKRVKGEK